MWFRIVILVLLVIYMIVMNVDNHRLTRKVKELEKRLKTVNAMSEEEVEKMKCESYINVAAVDLTGESTQGKTSSKK